MKVVFLTNLYPPLARGGYEQWCREVAVELRSRGHRVVVLTAKPNRQAIVDEENEIEVRRLLNLEVEGGVAHTALRLLTDRRRREVKNLDSVQQTIDEVRPDVGVIWGMWNVPRSVPALVEHLMPGRVAYYLCDYWPSLPNAYEQQLDNPAERTVTRLPKWVISRTLKARFLSNPPVSLQIEHPLCVSGAVRDLLVRDGIPIEHARVIHGGIQVSDFEPQALDKWEQTNGKLRLLYAGRLTEEKGVHTAVQAMAALSPRTDRPVTLDIVGDGEPRYAVILRKMVRRHHLGRTVRFRGRLPQAEMPALLADYDALVFPSEWQEPFARMVLEAMAVGLVVIGTTTGGTGDVLVEGETGLTFPPGDAVALANQIGRLRDDQALRTRLVRSARRQVEEKFTFTRMVDEIEDYLQSLAPIGAR